MNCRGLPGGSFDLICSLIPSTFDIFFFSETWYLASPYYASHPLFLCAPPTPPATTAGHRSGGILCVISPVLRRHSSFVCTPYSIDLSLFGSTIRALYLPPSLPIDSFSSHLLTSSSLLPDILLGDINVRLGPLTMDTASSPSNRHVSLLQTLQRGSYSLVLPSSGFAKNHHVLVRGTQEFSWSYVDASHLRNTDHKLMSCEFRPRVRVDLSDSQEAFRISLKCLQHAAIRSQCCEYFDLCAYELQMYCVDLLESVQSYASASQLDVYSIDERQRIVDYVDQAVSQTILFSAEEVCGTYTPSKMRATADQLFASIGDAPSISDAIRAFKRACRSNTVTLTSRDPAITPAQDAVAHFTAVFTQPNPDLLPPAVSPFRGVSFESEIDFDQDFTTDALVQFWSKYPTHVSGGLDGVHVRLLRALSDSSMPELVTILFRLCCLLGVTPVSWNRSAIFPIPKRKESTIDTFRPISLTVMLRRSFEKLFLRYIQRVPALRLHPTQAGFRRGFSTLTHAMVAHESRIFGQTHRVFYDFAQAYDTVPVPRLLERLVDRGIHPQILSLIDGLFLGTSSVVIINGQQTAPVQLSRGLFQGSLLSPLLFDLFIDELAFILHEDTVAASRVPRSLLFADDITAGATCRDDLQITTDKLATWSDTNGMVINLKKCGVVGMLPADAPLVIAGLGPIPQVDCYTYLGFPFEPGGINWVTHLETVVAKATSTLQVCQRNGSFWSTGLRLSFYRTFVRSQLDYGAGLIYHWMMQSLGRRQMPFPKIAVNDLSNFRFLLPAQALQTEAVEWITERRNAVVASHSLLALPLLMTRFSNLACLLTRHFRSMHQDNPARYMRSLIYFGPRKADRLLPFVSFHPDWAPWHADNKRLERGQLLPLPAGLTVESTSYPLRLWLRNKFLNDTLALGGVLPSIITREIRRRETGACVSIFLRSFRLRKNAIAWHLNHFAFAAKCICGSPFHRTHVESCFLERLLPLVPTAASTAFLSFTVPPHFPDSYNLIDFLLQRKHYSALAVCFGYLEFWLRPRRNYLP